MTRTHKTYSAAEAWLRDARRGEIKPVVRRAPKLRDAAPAWFRGARSGAIRTKSGGRYSESTLDGYEQTYNKHIEPEYGDVRLDRIARGGLNRFARDLTDRSLAPSTVRNIMMPLRAILRTAVRDEELDSNPTRLMDVPSGSGRRMRYLSVGEIVKFLRALDARDRPLWATAIYAGLRRGELMHLRWEDVDLAAGVITVHGTKTDRARRKVAICAELRELLLEHRQRAGARASGYVFCRGSLAPSTRGRRTHPANLSRPFLPNPVGTRGHRAANKAGIAPVTLHDCRHTFASLMIAAMVKANEWNPKALQEILGHESIQMTYDRYGHLWPGTEKELGLMLDAYLAPRNEAAADGSRLEAAIAEVWATVDNTPPEAAGPLMTSLIGHLGQWIAQQRPSILLSSVPHSMLGTDDHPATVQHGAAERDDERR